MIATIRPIVAKQTLIAMVFRFRVVWRVETALISFATHQAFDRFRGTSEMELKIWLRRVLLNQVTDAARRYVGSTKRDISRELAISRPSSNDGRSLLSGIYGSDPTPSALAMHTEQTAAVQKALSDLPPEQCETIVRRSIQQESFDARGDQTLPLGRETSGIEMLGKGVLIGRYELQEELGRGGCGAVFLATDTLLQRNVAIKVPATASGSDGRRVGRRRPACS